MPELPEVECIVRGLKDRLPGEKITGVFFVHDKMLRGIGSEAFKEETRGGTINNLERRGKYILFFLSSAKILEIHLRMTGRLYYFSGPTDPQKHTGAVFYLESGGELHYQDIRKFGTFRIYAERMLHAAKPSLLGLDPLAENFTRDVFAELLGRNPRRMIKSFFLDQKYIAGMGNIYTDETLFRAGINPERKIKSLSREETNRLFEALLSTLKEGIACGGTSISDYRDIWGRQGGFQKRLRVYRREGARCLCCGGVIRRKAVAGRGTYYCPVCQPLL